MGLLNSNQPPPLYVPDLTKPAGATIDSDGNVTCIACSTKLPVGRADVVGQGYRCAGCSARAEVAALAGGKSDVGANLSTADRQALHRAGMTMILPGIGGIVLGAVLVPFLRRAPYLLIAGGITSIAIGVQRMRTARG